MRRALVVRKAAPLAGALLFLASCAGGPQVAIHPAGRPAASPYPIVNVHEHIQSSAEAQKFLEAMDAAGIAHTILVGSPMATLTGKGGFERYDENNAGILTIQAAHPDRFSAFVTLNPRDPDKLRKLEGYVRAGAKGAKLYSGHSNFYDLPLTDASMEPVYAYLERRGLPALWHVNQSKFGGEFEAVLARHPRMLVILPHLGLSSSKLERLEPMLDRFANLSTDLSFGYDPFLIAALKRISRHPSKYRDFIARHRDRILFGTDMVVTKHKRKTAQWLADMMRCYRDMLESPQYRCALVGTEELRGLALDADTVRQIYEVNPKRFLSSGGSR